MDVFLYTSTALFWLLLVVPFLCTIFKNGREGVRWREKIALGWDVLIGSFFNLHEREYISEFLGRSKNPFAKVLAAIVDLAFLLLVGQKNHCKNAAETSELKD